MPDVRPIHRPAVDLVGIAASVTGLVAVTYGLIEAGHHGWIGARGLVPILAGIALLLAFFGWERRLSRQPGGEPLVDPALFRSASFTWGVTLQSVAILSLIGVSFTMPQYFQGVLGTIRWAQGCGCCP